MFRTAPKAVELYDIASEREYLEQNVLGVQLGENTGDVSSDKLGAELNPRNLDHTTDWHIVEVDGKKYDNDQETGWYFVERETNLPSYGKAHHSWLVNYETGEIIQLKENNYTDVSAGDMVYVKDNLIINVDSSLVHASLHPDQQTLEEQFGEGVHLNNFSFEENNDESGLTSTSFNFDGKDDYITVDYNEDKKVTDGITLEFYGKLGKDGKLYNYDTKGEYEDSANRSLNGFLELSNPNSHRYSSALGFGIDVDQNEPKTVLQLAWRLGYISHTIPEGFGRNLKC